MRIAIVGAGTNLGPAEMKVHSRENKWRREPMDPTPVFA
jgi:hypothetical protein